MNYSVLFPKITTLLPQINENDLCYNYMKNSNYNNMKIYMPSGRKLMLWFVKYDGNCYCLLIDNFSQNVKNKIHFKYMSFKRELTNGVGTILWVTNVDDQYCVNKILYYMGEKYTKKNILENMKDIKFIMDFYLNQPHDDIFMKLRLPVMSHDPNYVYIASSLNYRIYNILSSNNYSILLNEYFAQFQINVQHYKRDIYKLSCLNNNEIKEYDNAYVNDMKTSNFLKNVFRIKHYNYKEIELSDDEEDKIVDTDKYEEKLKTKNMIITCIYIPHMNKWKPYKVANNNRIDTYKKIKYIEINKNENKIENQVSE